MQGVFGLATPTDLLKLHHDYAVLEKDESAYAAFNFFITAEHIVDWLHPQNKRARRALRQDPLLGLVSHLANGAKHFGPLHPQHVSVKSTGAIGGYWPSSYFPTSYFGTYFGAGRRLGVLCGGTVKSCSVRRSLS